jgi:ATP-dependent Lon protease
MTSNNNYPENIIVVPLENKVLLPSVVLRLMIRGKQANDLTRSYFRQASASTTNKKPMSDIYVACIPFKPNFTNKNSKKIPLILNNSSKKSSDDEIVSQAPQVPVPSATAAASQKCNTNNDVLVNNVDRHRLLEYGCLARIVRVQRSGVDLFGIFVEGITRFKVSNFYQNTPSMTPYPSCWMAQVEYMNDDTRVMKELSIEEKEKIATFKELSQVFLIKMKELQLPETLLQQLSKVVNTTPVSSLADLLVALIETTFEERLTMLSTPLLKDRLQRASEWMTRQLHVLQISDTLGSGIEGKMSKKQREFYLRQQVTCEKKNGIFVLRHVLIMQNYCS